jgi:hypothetical protein
MAARGQTFTGGCLCGAVRFEVRGAPSNPHACSCKMCQRHTGAPTSVWVEFPRADVRWTGPAGAPRTWRSSPMSSRAFCAICGSSLGAVDDAPVIALLVGTFDAIDRKALSPKSHSYRSGRPRWWRVEVDAGRAASEHSS